MRLPIRRRLRLNRLRPRAAVPTPCVGERNFAGGRTTEHHDFAARRVERSGVGISRRRRSGGRRLRPRRSSPSPRVGVFGGAPTTEQDELAANTVERERGATTQRGRRRGEELRPRGSVPAPRVGERDVGLRDAGEEHNLASLLVVRHRMAMSRRRRGSRKGLRPIASVPAPRIGKRTASADAAEKAQVSPVGGQNAIACRDLPVGEVVGVARVHVVPSHVHVSASSGMTLFPPKSTAWPRKLSNTIAWR